MPAKASFKENAKRDENLLSAIIDDDLFQKIETELRQKIGLFEKPVDIETFLYDRDYLGLDIRLSEKQLEVLRACDDISPNNKINECILEIGKGGGKDTIVILVFARTIYLLLCLPDPLKYFGLAEMDTIDLLNVAVSADQARDVFFTRFSNLVKKAGHKAYKQFGFDPEKDILKSRINFPKHVVAYSGHSKQESQEGKNYFTVVMDECSGFLPHKAKALYDVMRTSINTRFPNIGKLYLISYPRYKDDYIERKYKEAEGRAYVYRAKGSTWEFNPLRKRSDFSKDFLENPEKAAAMYECKPEMSGDAYIKDLDKIAKIFEGGIENPLDSLGRFQQWFVRDVYLPKRYYMHVDLAKGRTDNDGFRLGDVAQLAMGYLDGEIVKIVFQKTYEGEPGKEIKFAKIQEDIVSIKRDLHFNLIKCTFDGWNSLKMIQDLNAEGVDASELSVDRTIVPYDTFKGMILQEKVKAYPLVGKIVNMPVINVLEEELKSLVILDGKKVDHIDDLHSKDLADAVCAVVFHCVKSENSPKSAFSWTTVRG